MTASSKPNTNEDMREDVEDRHELPESLKQFRTAPTPSGLGRTNTGPLKHEPGLEDSELAEEELLHRRLKDLEIQEKNLRLEKLQYEINEKRKCIRNLESSFHGSGAGHSSGNELSMSNPAATTNSDLKKNVSFVDSSSTPLDILLCDNMKLPSVKANLTEDQPLYKYPF